MKRKISWLTLLLTLVILISVLTGCTEGGWRVDNFSQTGARKVFYLTGNDGMTAEYIVQETGTTLSIYWRSTSTSLPASRNIELFDKDGVMIKRLQDPLNPSLFGYSNTAEPNTDPRVLYHKFTVEPLAFQYEKIQVVIYNDDGSLQTNKTFPITTMISKVTSYANKKRISLS